MDGQKSSGFSWWLTQYLQGRHGLIGNLVLDQFRVTIDYAHKTLYLKRQGRGDKPLATDRSGMFLMATGVRFRHLLVQEVAPGSPAWEAGIRAGDLITHVNRRPVRWLGLDGVNRRFRKPGGISIRMRIERQGQPRALRIPLRDYL